MSANVVLRLLWFNNIGDAERSARNRGDCGFQSARSTSACLDDGRRRAGGIGCGLSRTVSQSFRYRPISSACRRAPRSAPFSAFIFHFGVFGIQALAFAGGLAAVAAVYLIGALPAPPRSDLASSLVLAGVVIGTLLGSVVGLIKYLADPYNQLPAITFWLLGSLTGITAADLFGHLCRRPIRSRTALPVALAHQRPDFGRRRGSGVGRRCAPAPPGGGGGGDPDDRLSGFRQRHHRLDRFIDFSHFARLLVGPYFARLLPATLILGAGYLLGVDTLARTISTIVVPAGRAHGVYRHAVLHLGACRVAQGMAIVSAMNLRVEELSFG